VIIIILYLVILLRMTSEDTSVTNIHL
jgi:hypothetical protein